MIKKWYKKLEIQRSYFLWLFLFYSVFAHASLTENFNRLQQAYPQTFLKVTEQELVWSDGTRMPVLQGSPNKTEREKLENPNLFDQIYEVHYLSGLPAALSNFNPLEDPGRIRYEPFFKKMYGDSQAVVEAKLMPIFWLPKLFGFRYPLLVTTVNDVHKKLTQISTELETLCTQHPEYLPFLENPGGTYNWRIIANTQRLSPHSFGMAIDINPSLANYWQWDLEKAGLPISEETELTYHNNIPWAIVLIFEKYGFIWGGKWRHYDTMHFEYRPELLS